MRRHAGMAQPTRPVHQRGIALAEWTLAALLGAFILAAALAWLQSSLQLALLQRIPLQMAEETAWLLQRLQHGGMLAGQGGVHPLGGQDARLAAWQVSDGQGPGVPASDQLVLVRHLDVETLDCEGTRVIAGDDLVERYFLRGDSSAPGLVLACDAGACNIGGCRDLGDAGVPLQSDIDSLQVLYGLPRSPGQAVRYVDAATWRALSPRPGLASLRIGLLQRSRESMSRVRRWPLPADWLGLNLPPVTDRVARSAWQLTLAVPHG